MADEEFDDEDEFDNLEEEEEEEVVKPKKVKKKVKAPEPEEDKDWQIIKQSELFGVRNPETNEVVAQAKTIQDLQLQLLTKIACDTEKIVKNTE